MKLQNLILTQFRNHQKIEMQFSSGINTFYGPNGTGKTNILEAIQYLSMTKSTLIPVDSQNVMHGHDFFRIRGNFEKHKRSYEIICLFQKTKKKVLQVNEQIVEKFANHIGEFPIIMMHPYDVDLIRGGSEERRKFIDTQLCQLYPSYLQSLSRYQRALKHRNQLLKTFQKNRMSMPIDWSQIEPFDQVILKEGWSIQNFRKTFSEELSALFLNSYQQLGQVKEEVSLTYHCQFDSLESFKKQIFESRDKDLIMARSHVGIHKDDLVFKIGGQPLKKFGSQGQQKTYLIALKLALIPVFTEKKGNTPILLMDDIFDKLDDKRIRNLLELLDRFPDIQVFLTDARKERSQFFFKQSKREIKSFDVNLL